MRKNIPMCLKNSKEEGNPKFTVTPCLKNKGHKGKHEHLRLCRDNCCMCLGKNKPPRKRTWDMWATVNKFEGNITNVYEMKPQELDKRYVSIIKVKVLEK